MLNVLTKLNNTPYLPTLIWGGGGGHETGTTHSIYFISALSKLLIFIVSSGTHVRKINTQSYPTFIYSNTEVYRGECRKKSHGFG